MYRHKHTHILHTITVIVNGLCNYYYCELMFMADILGKSFGVTLRFYYETMWRMTTYISCSVFFKMFFVSVTFKN